MGQRANYIIKEGDKLTIHYTHWRANCIATFYFETDAEFNVLRQIQIFENGKVLKYDLDGS